MVFTPTSDHDRPFQFELQCPVETPMLRILRRLVHHLAQDMHFDDEEISKIEMAVVLPAPFGPKKPKTSP